MTFRNHLYNLRGIDQLKKIMVLTISIILIVSGCTKNDVTTDKSLEKYENKIQELEEKINILEAENEEMKKLINIYKKEKDSFFALSNMSVEFVRAHTKGNIEKMKELLSEEAELVERKNKIYVIIPHEKSGKTKWLVYDKSTPGIYQDMIIHGYHYVSNDDIYIIHIREIYSDSKGNIKIPPTYLDLYFKQINGVWKIVYLEFDL